MSICKNVLLTVKTASDIKRFQDEKEYGKWFDVLLPLMRTRSSCQPDQAIEPSVGANYLPEDSVSKVPQADTGSIEAIIDNDILSDIPDNSSTTNKELFVPVKTKSVGKSSVSKKIEATNVQVTEVLGQIKTVLEIENSSTKEILEFFERENERARKHELELFKI